MHSEQFWSDVEPYLKQLLPLKFKKVVGMAGLAESDEDDFKQQLSLLVWLKRGKFDPARASARTFAARVVENGICEMLRKRLAQERGGNRVFLADDISLLEVGRRWGLDESRRRPDEDDLELLRTAARTLPPELHETAHLLVTGCAPATIARRLKRSRRQVDKQIAGIREHLRAFDPLDPQNEQEL